jgi:hypothetical protein
MKKIVLVCAMFVFAFALQEQRLEESAVKQSSDPAFVGDVFPTPDPLFEQIWQARKDGDWTTYNRLVEQYEAQFPAQKNSGLSQPEAIMPEDDPLMRWGGDVTIYSGDVAYNSWAMALDVDDEAISVDHHRGDTLRAAVACADSAVRIYQSNDNGMTWSGVISWTWTGRAFYEPEIINDPAGRFYHVFSRISGNNGDIVAFTDSTPGGWYYSMIDDTPDTVLNYSVSSDRAQYSSYYYLFCAYHKALGGAGQDQIYFTTSTSYGASWATPTLLQTIGSAFPDLAFGSNDYLYLTRLFYRLNDTINVYTRVSANEGGSWSASYEIFGDTTQKQGPQIAAAHDGSGDAWVIFPRRDPGTANYDYGMLSWWTENFGTSWTGLGYVHSVSNYMEVLPSIAIYDNSTSYYPYISFIRSYYDWTDANVYTFNLQSDTTWSTAETYNDHVPEFIRPIQTWEAEGVPAFAYVGDNGVNVYFDSWSNTGVEESEVAAPRNLLGPSYPNPFVTMTRFSYTVPVSGMVTIRAFNTIGQHVVTLVQEHKAAGTYTVTWNGKDSDGFDLPKGIYFLKFEYGDIDATRKLILE